MITNFTIDGYDIHVIEDFDDQSGAEWESLGSTSIVGEIFSSVPWCKMSAKSDGNQYYFMAYKDHQVKAALASDIMPDGVPDHYHLQGILTGNSVTKAVPKWEYSIDLMPCMLGTTRAGRSCDIRLQPSDTAEDQKAAVRALLKGFERFGALQGTKSVGLVFVPRDHRVIQDALSELGFHRATLGVSMYLPITFSNFTEYLAIFRSGRRSAIRQELRRVSEAQNVHFEHKSLADGLENHVTFNAYNVEKYSSTSPDREYLRQRAEYIIEMFGDDAFVIEMYYDNKIIGSMQAIKYHHNFFIRVIGVHPEAPKSLAPYFHIGFYELIRLALEQKINRIIYLQEKHQAKLSRGCLVEHQDLFVKTDNPAIIERMQVIDEYMTKYIAELIG